MIDANHGSIGRNRLHWQPIQFAELYCLSGGRPGHAANPRIQRDQVLQRDGAQNLPWRFVATPSFDFDRGVKSRGPAPILRDRPLNSSTISIAPFFTM